MAFYETAVKTPRQIEEEKQKRLQELINKRNRTKQCIEQVTDSSTYLQAKTMLNIFGSLDAPETDVYELSVLLEQKANEVVQALEDEESRISKALDTLQADHYAADVKDIEKINVQSDHKVLEILTQMTKHNDTNKRRIGTFVANADRVQAMALIKIAIMPQYADLFTDNQRQLIAKRSKTEEQIRYEEQVNARIEEKKHELGKVYMKKFQMKNAMKKKASHQFFNDQEH